MLSPVQVNLVSELAEHFYDYLPGSSQWNAYTFASAAEAVGVGEFWAGGSKAPAIAGLLENTLDIRPERLAPLVERVVLEGIKYRRRKGNPVRREDVQRVNSLLRQLGIAYSRLSNEEFINSLPTARTPETENPVSARPHDAQSPQNDEPDRLVVLARLRETFLALSSRSDRQQAGRELEGLLHELFGLFGLQPTGAFRIVGEQIDGAFVFESANYLLEAKWYAARVDEAALLVFRGKVEGKSSFTRGLFISVNGYSGEALVAIRQGKQPNFVMADGAHLFRVLDGAVGLDDLFRSLVRRLAERGEPYVPVTELV